MRDGPFFFSGGDNVQPWPVDQFLWINPCCATER